MTKVARSRKITKKSITAIASIIILVLPTATLMIPQLSFIPPSPLDAEKHVLAFYYDWYGNNSALSYTNYSNSMIGVTDISGPYGTSIWGNSTPINWTYIQQFSLPRNESEVISNNFTMNKTWMDTAHFPEWGPYHSADPAKMKKDLVNAAYCGVDTFIMTWWGRNNYIDQNFENFLNYAYYLEVNESIQNIPNFTMYFEHAQDWPEEYGPHEEEIVNEIVYFINRYGNHPKFFKVNNIPVIFIWATTARGTTLDRWVHIKNKVEMEVGKLYWHAMGGYGRSEKGLDTLSNPLFSSIFDGFHVYMTSSLLHNVGDEEEAAPHTIRQLYQHCVDSARKKGINFAPGILPGYDDTNIPDREGSILNRRGTIEYGNKWTYAGMWEDAIAVGVKWVCIVTWNEWWEGTEIDTSYEYGELFLNMTKTYSTIFKSS
ncbi:MAG: glycoside hydrolase family 99-like domain-containing protein [Candidatus Hodarchaeota archaeon]